MSATIRSFRVIAGSIEEAATRSGRKPEAKRSEVKKILTPMQERGKAAGSHHLDNRPPDTSPRPISASQIATSHKTMQAQPMSNTPAKERGSRSGQNPLATAMRTTNSMAALRRLPRKSWPAPGMRVDNPAAMSRRLRLGASGADVTSGNSGMCTKSDTGEQYSRNQARSERFAYSTSASRTRSCSR